MRLHVVALIFTLASSAYAQASTGGEIARAACHGRRPCRVDETHDAGRDANGNALTVVKLLLSPPSHPHADGSPAIDGDCARFEWTLLSWRRDRLRAHPLVEICNDGYGARGVGEDTVQVSDDRFSHTRSGGSAWGWSESTTLSLSPLAVIAHGSAGWWTLGPSSESRFVEYPELLAGGTWFAPICGTPRDVSAPSPDAEARWTSVPRVTLGPRELAALRRGIALGTCGAVIDGTPQHGLAIEGEADPGSASLRALWPEDGPLVLEVTDDELTSRDRVEVWVGPERPSYMDECREPSAIVAPRRYAITLADGRVEALSGGRALRVTRRAIDGRVVLLVALPADTRTLSVALDDADGANGTIVRRIASSTLDPRDAASLGDVAEIDAATCRLEDGALQALIDTRVGTDGPAIDGP